MPTHEIIVCKKTEVFISNFQLSEEQNLLHLDRFMYFSQKVIGVTLKGLDCLGTVLLVELGEGGGVSDLRMADSLMNFVDELNLKGFHLWQERFWVGGRGHRRA